MTIVRSNLMTRRGYMPYCGECLRRTQFDGRQFYCGCGWRSEFPDSFITEYINHWSEVERRYVIGDKTCTHCMVEDVVYIGGDNYSDEHWQCVGCCSTYPFWLYPKGERIHGQSQFPEEFINDCTQERRPLPERGL
jgi:hypothetical protein